MASVETQALCADDARFVPPEDLASASGILMFCVRRACAIPLQGSDSDGQFGWKVISSFGLVYATTYRTTASFGGCVPFDYPAGLQIASACRTIARSWSKWIPHRVTCCDCGKMMSWHRIPVTVNYAFCCEKKVCLCASQTHRHPRCITCQTRPDNGDDPAPHEHPDLCDTSASDSSDSLGDTDDQAVNRPRAGTYNLR